MADGTWLDDEELRIFQAFARSTRWIFVQFNRDLQRTAKMPRAYFEILWLLQLTPDHALRMSDLAAATGSQPSRITHAVGSLERAGHVRRELYAADRRVWLAVLTDEGRSAIERVAPEYAESIRRRLLEPLTKSQRDDLARIGETLIEALETSGAPLPSRNSAWLAARRAAQQ